ncbi:hypothetical protein H9P43_002765 [Blastocladiella emersonii ATCC 22665]|nr:hypothetical protein H9P43_002765 [Blastocladiella emersonii ATCC 22665]
MLSPHSPQSPAAADASAPPAPTPAEVKLARSGASAIGVPTFRFISHGDRQPLAISPSTSNARVNARRGATESPEATARKLMDKWGFTSENSYLRCFSYDQFVAPHQYEAFLKQFFADPVVRGDLQLVGSTDALRPLSGSTGNLAFHPLAVTRCDMSIFDGLFDSGVVRRNGAIVKCFDDYYSPAAVPTAPSADLHAEPGDTLIPDELRRAMLDASSDHFDSAVTTTDRRELLYHLFAHLVLGGRVNQFEDEIAPYLTVAKLIYKKMISATRSQSDPNVIQLHGAAFAVLPRNADSTAPLFPMRHRQNFLIAAIDPLRRRVTLWYHASTAFY